MAKSVVILPQWSGGGMRWSPKNLRKKSSCKGFSAPRDGFGSPLRHDAAPRLAALGPEVDYVIGRLDDVQIVLDDHDRVPLIDQLVQDVEQLVRVVEVQAGRRLVEDVERPAGAAPRQLLREFDPLRLAAA